MFVSGLFGGFVNYLLEKRDNPEKSSILRSMSAGIAASFLVPLFLNMISSDLMIKSAIENEKLLIFAGFCLIASISSSAFIRTLSDKILKEAQEAKEIAQEVKEDVAPVLDKETEQDSEDDSATPKITFAPTATNTDKVLRALADSKFAMRSATGICKDVQLDRGTVEKELWNMTLAGLVYRSERKKGIRWSITASGRAFLEK